MGAGVHNYECVIVCYTYIPTSIVYSRYNKSKGIKHFILFPSLNFRSNMGECIFMHNCLNLHWEDFSVGTHICYETVQHFNCY